MWLINTRTLGLEFILKPETKPYVILSHTWEDEEVTFQEMTNLQGVRKKKGFAKIKMTCKLARRHDPPIEYAWVDTCCIDKKSSTELAEAINSMFAWYKKATVCFVFLSDFPPHEPVARDLDLPKCRWFTRGWTLQELIAPKMVDFYDSGWNFHGSKLERKYEIANITGVDVQILEDSSLLHTIPVGERMYWASRRQTSREEDMAYCLLGIFDVNMTMIYGEGEKAFIRLQEQIMKDSNDMTLFAWTSNDSSQVYRGLLAQSASVFKACREIGRSSDVNTINVDYALTNNGLRIETCLGNLREPTAGSGKDYILDLSSWLGGSYNRRQWIGIYLTKTPNGFVRHLPGKLYFASRRTAIWAGKPAITYIRKEVTPEESKRLEAQLRLKIQVTFDLPSSLELDFLAAQPSNLWDQHNQTFIVGVPNSCHGFLSVGFIDNVTGTRVHFVIICQLDVSKYGKVDEPVVSW